MGQAKRRKAEIEQLKRENARGISIVAVHEAGHVAGRFMTAELMGLDPDDAVSFVEMHHPDTARVYRGLDGNLYIPQATTYGPMYSRAIEAASEIVMRGMASTPAKIRNVRRGWSIPCITSAR
jgi:hypothetical protein